jgi:hypothetical protein
MLNYAVIGVGVWMLSFVMLILHVVATLTNSSSIWGNMRLVDLGLFDSLAQSPLRGLEHMLACTLHMSLFMFLFIVGILMFIVDGLYGRK